MTDRQRSQYLRIADALEQRITSRELPPGARLPPIPELAQAEGVSEAPVRMAFEVLKRKGLLESRGRAGTCVTTPAPDVQLSAERYHRQAAPGGTDFTPSSTPSTSRVDRRDEHLQASRELAGLFEIRPGTRLLARHLVLHTDDVPHQMLTSYLRWVDVAGTALADPATAGLGTVRAELESIGIHPTDVTEEFTYGTATTDEAHTLNLRAGTAVSRCTRRHLTADGRVVEVAQPIVYRADTLTIHNRFALED